MPGRARPGRGPRARGDQRRRRRGRSPSTSTRRRWATPRSATIRRSSCASRSRPARGRRARRAGGPGGAHRSGRALRGRGRDASASVVGAASLLIFVRVQNVAVRTLTATCVTRRPSATTLGHLPGQPVDVGGDLGRVGDVRRERLLPAAPLGDVRLVDDRRSSPPRPRIRRCGPIVGPKARASASVSARARSSTVTMPEFSEPCRGAVADAPDRRHRLGAEAGDPLGAGEHGDPARLGPPGRRLGQQAGVADARRRTTAGCAPVTAAWTSAASRRGSSVVAPMNASSQPQTSTAAGERAQRGHHLGRRGVVRRPVRRQEHAVRAAPQRLGERHARVHPERPRLVRRRGDHLPRPPRVAVPADHDGQPASSGRRRTSTAARNWSRSTCRTQPASIAAHCRSPVPPERQ